MEKEKRVIHRDNIIKIMKKIYNYLFPVFLSLFALAACDEDNEEIVPMSYTDPVATVTKIDPVEGYVGNEFPNIESSKGDHERGGAQAPLCRDEERMVRRKL